MTEIAQKTGILPCQELEALIAAGAITSATPGRPTRCSRPAST
jgi:hypothetical protein